MKWFWQVAEDKPLRRTPRGVRGLKFSIRVISNTSLSSRTPRGVRGLKLEDQGLSLVQMLVAPLAGCVD